MNIIFKIIILLALFNSIFTLNLVSASEVNTSEKKSPQTTDKQSRRVQTTGTQSRRVQITDLSQLAGIFKPKSSPQYTVGGGIRGNNCRGDQESRENLIAMTSDVNYTAKTHPEFLVYIPPIIEAKGGTLIIKDKNEDYYYQQAIKIPAKSGFINLKLDPQAPPLEKGQQYQGFVSIFCGNNPQPSDPNTQLTINKVDLEIPTNLSEEESLLLLANNSIWYNSVAIAYHLKEENPLYFQQLLKSIGMEHLFDK